MVSRTAAPFLLLFFSFLLFSDLCRVAWYSGGDAAYGGIYRADSGGRGGR
jgi:hypothetical protein